VALPPSTWTWISMNSFWATFDSCAVASMASLNFQPHIACGHTGDLKVPGALDVGRQVCSHHRDRQAERRVERLTMPAIVAPAPPEGPAGLPLVQAAAAAIARHAARTEGGFLRT
jgi:hypothetical protein